ncbi:MAG: hypothetical protein KKH28_05070 [Elusimicrobia bacterium]|nr:hypothetical protein [Elusimicrobiota bacterium]
MTQAPEYPEQKSLRLRSKQLRLGFVLALGGIFLQWIPGNDAWRIVLGWPVAAMGTLLCARTLLGDLGWCLLSLLPLIGAPLSLIGILVQYRLRGGAAPVAGRRYFLWYEFLMIFIAIAAFWGGLAWLRLFCRQNGGCSFE